MNKSNFYKLLKNNVPIDTYVNVFKKNIENNNLNQFERYGDINFFSTFNSGKDTPDYDYNIYKQALTFSNNQEIIPASINFKKISFDSKASGGAKIELASEKFIINDNLGTENYLYSSNITFETTTSESSAEIPNTAKINSLIIEGSTNQPSCGVFDIANCTLTNNDAGVMILKYASAGDFFSFGLSDTTPASNNIEEAIPRITDSKTEVIYESGHYNIESNDIDEHSSDEGDAFFLFGDRTVGYLEFEETDDKIDGIEFLHYNDHIIIRANFFEEVEHGN